MRDPAGDSPVSRAAPDLPISRECNRCVPVIHKLVRKRQKLFCGRNIEATNGQEQIPLFVKDDSLLPLAEPVEWIGTETCFNLTVHAFGAHPVDFVLYEDDAVSDAFKAGRQNQIHLHWDDKGYLAMRTGKSIQPVRV